MSKKDIVGSGRQADRFTRWLTFRAKAAIPFRTSTHMKGPKSLSTGKRSISNMTNLFDNAWHHIYLEPLVEQFVSNTLTLSVYK